MSNHLEPTSPTLPEKQTSTKSIRDYNESDDEENNQYKKKNFKEVFHEFIHHFEIHLPKYDSSHFQLFKDDEMNLIYMLQVIYYDYMIFLPNQYFLQTYLFWNNKNKFIKYLEKYNIIYFPWEKKSVLLYLINLYNEFIKNTKEDIHKLVLKDLFIKNVHLFEENYFRDNLNFKYKIFHQLKWKEIYIQDANIDVNVFYKKIRFSNQELFLNFNQYSTKRIEYKLRSFCQIAEELGAEKIELEYTFHKNISKELYHSLKGIELDIGYKLNKKTDNGEKINLTFEYPSNHIHINLNKYHLVNKILKENQFLISKDEFDADVELKYLIDARCTNFIQKYNTQFSIESCNFIERKIFTEAHRYGIEMDTSIMENKSIQLSIYVEFYPLNNNYQIIDGTNIHVMREGFLFLMKMLNDPEYQDERKYMKMIQFIKSHFYAIEQKWVELPYEYLFQDKILKIFKQMIEQNYQMDEFLLYIEQYFKKNIGWNSFLHLRDILLKGNHDLEMDKLNFITTQYYDIISCKKNILDNIQLFIQKNIFTILIQTYSFDSPKINKFMKKKICKDICQRYLQLYMNIFRKSFYLENGLSNPTNLNSLQEVIYHLIMYNFDSELYQLYIFINQLYDSYKIIHIDTYIDFKKNFVNKIDDILNDLEKNNYFLKKNENIPQQQREEVSSSDRGDHVLFLNSVIFQMSILERQYDFFIKFIVRYFQYHNKLSLLSTYYDMNNLLYLPDSMKKDIKQYFPLSRLFSNYASKRLFFIYTDFEEYKTRIEKNDHSISKIYNSPTYLHFRKSICIEERKEDLEPISEEEENDDDSSSDLTSSLCEKEEEEDLSSDTESIHSTKQPFILFRPFLMLKNNINK